MKKRPSKRRQQAALFFTYGAMTFAVIVISAICILLALGYQFDTNKGKIAQGGLLQFVSVPNNATVTLNGKKLGFTTPGKIEIGAGTHTVNYTKEGYRSWSKKVNVKPGELRWLNSARLLPESIQTTPIDTLPHISQMLPSPDRKYIAIVPDQTKPQIILYDVRDSNNLNRQTTFTLEPEVVTEKADVEHIYSLVEWDFGARFMLLKHTFGDNTEYIRVDRTAENGKALNITKNFNLPFSDPHFSGTSGNILYALTNQDLRRVDLGAQSVSQPLISNIISYKLYREKDIAYISLVENEKIVGVYMNEKKTELARFGKDEDVKADLTKYFDDFYLAVAHGNSLQLIQNPTLNSKSTITLENADQIQWVDFSNSGRFLLAGKDFTYTTYDLETKERFSINQAGVLPRPDATPQWLDDYHVLNNSASELTMSEFDGTNVGVIVNAEPGLAATFSEDNIFLFSVGKTEAGHTLQASRLILN